MYFTKDDGSQNIMFVYQPTLDMLEFKKGKGIDYVLSWESKRVYTGKLKPLHTAFLHSIKLSGYRLGIRLDKYPLVSCRTKQSLDQNCSKKCSVVKLVQ